METTTTATTGPDSVRSIAEACNEPAWLAEWRHRAWDRYEAAPLPDRVVHLWRYSEPEKFLPDKVTPTVPAAGDPSGSMPDRDESAAASILIENGAVAALEISDAARDAGVILTDLSTAAREHESLVREHLGSAVGDEFGKFEALNAAMFAGGVFVHVPRDVYLEEPIYVRQRATRDLAGVFPRVLIVLERGAEATVIDEYVNDGAPRTVASAVVEGVALANSRLAYFNIQRWGDRTRSHAAQRMLVHRDAAVTTVNIGLGGQYSKADLGNIQVGDNASAEMIGVVFGAERQHFDNHTEHVHRVGNSFSDMDFKVVLEDHASSAYTGLIRIDLEARNSEAYQENRNLMLDPTCQAESIPELEILNEDVRCTHGATVGPIDEEMVYYLRTRGLTERDAEQLIVEGFFGPALDRIEDDSLRDRLWSAIGEKLAGRRS